MPGRSLTRPPRTSTTECSWRLCPSPGMYVVTSMPFVRRTRATLRSAEFGFFGVCVKTRVQTPRRCGAPATAVTAALVGVAAALGTLVVVLGALLARRRAQDGRDERLTLALERLDERL